MPSFERRNAAMLQCCNAHGKVKNDRGSELLQFSCKMNQNLNTHRGGQCQECDALHDDSFDRRDQSVLLGVVAFSLQWLQRRLAAAVSGLRRLVGGMRKLEGEEWSERMVRVRRFWGRVAC